MKKYAVFIITLVAYLFFSGCAFNKVPEPPISIPYFLEKNSIKTTLGFNVSDSYKYSIGFRFFLNKKNLNDYQYLRGNLESLSEKPIFLLTIYKVEDGKNKLISFGGYGFVKLDELGGGYFDKNILEVYLQKGIYNVYLEQLVDIPFMNDRKSDFFITRSYVGK